MKGRDKRRAITLGARIGLVFVMALAVVILVVYYVLSQNFSRLLTDYSIQLVQSMIGQGVTLVENELESGRKEISLLADSFDVPETDGGPVEFQTQIFDKEDFLRMTYVTETGTTASDGRTGDVRGREDIAAAFDGTPGIYGPYFDEAGQYVICFTAPVWRDGEVAGVLSVEKDGYLFSRLIKDLRFADSGECYVIDANGTDIAVSDPNHIEWVDTQYNGRKLLEEKEDPTTRSIVELEQKGLDGETGVGTYLWNGNVYVAYQPVPSTGWVFLAGLREEEITAMTRSVIYASVENGPALRICFTVFLLLAALMVYWIAASMKKNEEINRKLELIANHDSLTGLLNRRFLETELSERWSYPVKISGSAAVYMMDIDDFKKYNDFFGHQKGDDCLRTVSGIFKNTFQGKDSYVMRYGGEEFVAVAFLLDQSIAMEKGKEICRSVENEKLPNGRGGYVTVSIGICHVDLTSGTSLYDCIKNADGALYRAKGEGKNRAVLVEAEDKGNGQEAM